MTFASDETAPTKAVLGTVVESIAALPFVDRIRTEIRPEDLLIEDLGFDSLRFVDLVIAIEDAFQLKGSLPIQDWVDESLANNLPISVGRLAALCASNLGGSLSPRN